MVQNRQYLFDNWAARYDSSVGDGTFPFLGYEKILHTVLESAAAEPTMSILDVGTGTGNLARLFADMGCTVYASDFSQEMLERAAEKLPGATLIRHDLCKAWPTDLDRPFDRIVSAYVLHEFDLPAKVELLRKFIDRLSSSGKIIIADIAFESAAIREAAARKWTDVWDEDEFYWAADEMIEACHQAGMTITYTQISSCGGVFVIMP